MQLEQFIPYFRQSISQFVVISSNSENAQQYLENASQNVTLLSKHEMFLQVAFHILTQHAQTNTNYENILISNLIKDKFKYQFETIAQQNLQYYYRDLIRMFGINMKSSRAFFCNIELSLAYIFISTVSNIQASIQNYLGSIISQNEQLAKSAKANFYLKVLGYISSQIQDNRLVIDQNTRQKAKNYLIQNQKHILIILNNACPMLWDNTYVEKQRIIQTFTAWVSLTYDQVVYQCLPNHFLTDKVFQLLRDDQTIDVGVQSIKSIIQSAKSYQENHDLLNLFLDKVKNYLALQTQKLIKNREFNTAQSYIQVIIIISDKLFYKYIQEIQQYFNFIKKIIELSFNKSIDLTNHTIYFWQEFFNLAYNYINQTNYQHIDKFQQLADFCYQKLLVRCQFSKSQMQKLQFEEQSDIKKLKDTLNTREDSQDLFINISRIISINQYVKLVTQRINQFINKQEIQWSQIQVSFFSLLIKPIQTYLYDQSNQNNDYLALLNSYYYQLVQKENLPIIYDNKYYIPIAVKRTFLKFLKYMIKIKNLNHDIIKYAMQYSIINFSNTLLCYQAQKAFSRLCEVQGSIIQGNIEERIKLIQKYPLKPYIITGVLSLICRKSENIQQYLYTTFQKVFNMALKHSQSHKQKGQMLCLISASRILLQNSIIQNYLDIVVQIYKMLWPFIQNNLKYPKYVEDDQDIGLQRTTKIIKFIMRCLKQRFSQFLKPLFNSVKQGYCSYPVCSYLYIFQITVPIFSKNPSYQSLILDFYKFLCNQTMHYFKQKYKDIQRYILLLQDFIGMNKKFFMCNSSLVSKSQMFEEILNICYYFVLHDNMRVSRVAYSYFEAIFMVYWKQEFIQQYNQQLKEKSQMFIIQNQQYIFYNKFKQSLIPQIPQILTKAFYHLSQCPTEATKQYILQCIFSQIKAFPLENIQIWAHFFNNFPSQIMLINQKQQFLYNLSLLNEDNNAIVNKSLSSIKRLLNLISKRYIYAQKRSKFKLFPS